MYSTALHGNGLRVPFQGDKRNLSDYMDMSRFGVQEVRLQGRISALRV